MDLKKWHIAGILFTVLFGTLNHFIYGWSGENPLAAPFCAVNESTWEHLKLLVTPMLFFTGIEYCMYGRYRSGFLPVRAISLLLGMFFIVSVFYGYTALAGDNYLWADILTFVLAVISSFLLDFRLLQRRLSSKENKADYNGSSDDSRCHFCVERGKQPPLKQPEIEKK